MPTARPAIHKSHRRKGRPQFERIALLLQGGGALGAYQAGAYQALAEADLHPDWIAGISIGAINAELLAQAADEKVYNIIHLIYHAKNYEGTSKDYEFSRRTMEEHWKAGYNDAVRTLRHPEVLQRPNGHDGVLTFDLAQDGRE